MGAGSFIRGAWELVPILLLLLVGGLIAIRSGINHRISRQDLRQIMGNLSHIVLRVLAYGTAMLLIHDWIGLRPGFGW